MKPNYLPNLNAPIVGINGRLTPPWIFFFQQSVQLTTPIETVAPGASPFTYTASQRGNLLVTGGTVSNISLIRGTDVVSTGLTAGFFPVSQDDQIVVTYSVLPTVKFISG